jgi:LysM domain-containing protein
MSVATEFPPTVYIPERARPAVRAVEPAVDGVAVPVRHLALVPSSVLGGKPSRRIERLPARPAGDRVLARPFADSTVDWPLTVPLSSAPMRITRRGVAVLLMTAVAVGLLLLAVARASAPHGANGTGSMPANATVQVATVQVQPGDTLWSIAQRVAPQRDPRQVVDQLRRLNQLRSVSLTPGQTLKVG